MKGRISIYLKSSHSRYMLRLALISVSIFTVAGCVQPKDTGSFPCGITSKVLEISNVILVVRTKQEIRAEPLIIITNGAETPEPESFEEPPDYLSILDVEYAPICTFRLDPVYPDSLREAGIEGNVTLFVYVKPDGTVGEADIQQSSGVEALDQAAFLAVWNTRWMPAMVEGEAVGVWTHLFYRFELQ